MFDAASYAPHYVPDRPLWCGLLGADSQAFSPQSLTLAQEGREQFQRGDYAGMEKTYRQILARAPDDLHVWSNLGVVLFREEKLKEAEEALKKAIALAPEDGFSHRTLGIVYYNQAKYDEAIAQLTKALAINPVDATAYSYLGIAAAQKGWMEAAQTALETAVRLDPQSTDAAFNLVALKVRQTPTDRIGARQFYLRALELGSGRDGETEDIIAGRDLPAKFDRRGRKARTQFSNGDYEGAEKTYREIVTAVPDHGGALASLGVILLRERKYDLAGEVLKKALTISPDDDVAHYTLGLVYYGEKKFAEAVVELTKAAEANPPNMAAGAYLKILREQKIWQETTQEKIEKALQLNPVYSEGRLNQFVNVVPTPQ